MGAVREVPIYLGTCELYGDHNRSLELVDVLGDSDFKQAPTANAAAGLLL